MMHVVIAEILVNRLTPDYQEPVERGPGLLRRALSRIAARLSYCLSFGMAAEERQAQSLDAQLERLAKISPHLLVDIGMDPVTMEHLDPEALPMIARPRPESIPTATLSAQHELPPLRLHPSGRGFQPGVAPA